MESTFEWLERVPVSRKHARPVERRVKILEDTVRELRKYHTKAGREKKHTLDILIDKYTRLIEKLK